MVETVIGCVFVGGSFIWLVAAVRQRFLGVRDFGDWQGGGKVTFTARVAACVFLGSIGGGFLYPSGIWLLTAIPAWVIGYVHQNRANRDHHDQEEGLQRTNAADHPGIFDAEPPTDLSAIPGRTLDLYDAGSCVYLGTVAKSDVRAVIDATSDMPDQGANDIFLIHESFDFVPEGRLSEEFVRLVDDALSDRDYLILRWMPKAKQVGAPRASNASFQRGPKDD